MKEITKPDIENATLEAIYWWNRDESYYHKYFSQLGKIYHDKPLLDFFIAKIFEVFLREYSIRRNLSAGYESVNNFIDELSEYEFINGAKQGDTDIIDEVSDRIKANGKSTNRQVKSLLSKVAFLINPSDFSLYDTLSKKSIWNLYKHRKRFKYNELDNYNGFIKQTNLLRDEIAERKLFENSNSILKQFKNTAAYNFFNPNQKAYEMRIVDKYLWLLEQNSDGRKLINHQYIKLNRMTEK